MRHSDPPDRSTWPDYDYQLHTGHYGGLDDRHKRRKRKIPVGFQLPPAKPKRKRKR